MFSDIKSSFNFSDLAMKKVDHAISSYPKNKSGSAVMELLYIAQEECKGWIPLEAMDKIASILEISKGRVYEVANFYSMYNLKPVGKYVVNICRTTPCWLCGGDAVLDICKTLLGIDLNQTTNDGLFTLREVECLGACVDAPVIQVNNDYYHNVDKNKLEELFKKLREEGVRSEGK